jgi:uncharacterized protein YidB (DUF937 family)
MGLLDNLGGMVGQLAEGAAPGLISAALAKTNLGDMQGLVNRLQQGGLGDQVKSWLGNGSNMPVTADQLRAALGNDQVKQLAEHVPAAVDQASPNGTLY